MFGVASSCFYQAVEIRLLVKHLLVITIGYLMTLDQIILRSAHQSNTNSTTHTLLIKELERRQDLSQVSLRLSEYLLHPLI